MHVVSDRELTTSAENYNMTIYSNVASKRDIGEAHNGRMLRDADIRANTLYA
jgi:hypothetical protein